MKKLILFPLMILSFSLIAQIEATTESGKKVILNNDGTWSFKTESISPAMRFDKSDCKYETREVDDFSGQVKLRTKRIEIGRAKTKDRFHASLARNGDYNFFMIKSITADLGCMVSMKSSVQLKMADGEILEFIHIGDTDCSDGAPFRAFLVEGELEGLKDSELMQLQEETIRKLKSKPVNLIRVKGSEYYADIILDKEGEAFFMKNLPCLE